MGLFIFDIFIYLFVLHPLWKVMFLVKIMCLDFLTISIFCLFHGPACVFRKLLLVELFIFIILLDFVCFGKYSILSLQDEYVKMN